MGYVIGRHQVGINHIFTQPDHSKVLDKWSNDEKRA